MKQMLKTLMTLLATALPALAADKPGAFDYYVLSLTWSPGWCADQQGQGGEQCAPGAGHGFLLHGLWPQYEAGGWPEYCRTSARDPSRQDTRAMADIFGSSGLAWHQWKKHGRCSGLSSRVYFDLSRRAYRSITRPKVLRQIKAPLHVPPKVIEAAFIEANPGLHPDGITVRCKSGDLQEVRICFDKDLTPRQCGRDTRKDCGMKTLLVEPVPK